MDWDDVRVFLAVARGRGLTPAGRALKTSPQTVGRRVTALEAAVGCPLFLRGPTGYQLTEDGQAVMATAERIEEDVARFRASASGRATAIEGTVRLAAPDGYVTHLLLPGLGTLLDRHPGLHIDFVTGTDALSLSRGDADLAVRLVRPETGDLKVRRVGTMSSALYAAESYLKREPAAATNPLEAARLIGWDETHAHLPAARWLATHARQKPVCTFTNLSTQRAATFAGLGVALLPCFYAAGLVRVGGVTTEPVWLVTHAASIASDRVRAVVDAVESIIQRAREVLDQSSAEPNLTVPTTEGIDLMTQ